VPPNSTYAWSITTSPSRRSSASSGVSAPVGLCGVQIQVSRAPAGSSERTPPASRVAFSNIA